MRTVVIPALRANIIYFLKTKSADVTTQKGRVNLSALTYKPDNVCNANPKA
jgi:hypothetical protein